MSTVKTEIHGPNTGHKSPENSKFVLCCSQEIARCHCVPREGESKASRPCPLVGERQKGRKGGKFESMRFLYIQTRLISCLSSAGTHIPAALFTYLPSAFLRTSFVPVQKETRQSWGNISSASPSALLLEGEHLIKMPFK